MKQKITPRICLPHRRRETSEALGLSKPCRGSFFRLRCGMSAELPAPMSRSQPTKRVRSSKAVTQPLNKNA